MRLVDVILRQGHLSEMALLDAIMTGERPGHLDRCDLCGERALALGRSLDGVRSAAIDAADQVFPAERLAAQHGQILRRLEQIDEPARVIAFPAASSPGRQPMRYRVAPAWIGVAAAAGLVIGAIGGQATARLGRAAVPQVPPATVGVVPSSPAVQPLDRDPIVSNASIFDMDLESFIPEPLGAINELTPRTTTLVSLNTTPAR